MLSSLVLTPTFPAGVFAFRVHDPEEMASVGRGLGWIGEYLATGRRYDVTIEASQTSRMQLMRVFYRCGSVERGEGPDDTCVFVVSRPSGSPSRFRGELLDDTRLGLICPGAEYEFHTRSGDDLLMLGVPRDWIEREALARWERPLIAAGDRATVALDHPNNAARLIAAWSSQLQASVRRPDRLRRLEDAGRLEAVLLEALIGILAPPDNAPARPARREAARRAERFLRENSHQPIKMIELCRELGLVERTLQDGFREVYGTSPLSYLRKLRLQSARAHLAATGPERRISQIALDCGFTHFGRFSVDYHQHFGETPSETRSRRQQDLPARRG
jgi:AraC-like DNA-binding protein